MTLAADDPRHGTENGYNNLKCRCGACTEAHRVEYRRRREAARIKAAANPTVIPHGTATGRRVMLCDCEACRTYLYPTCWPLGVRRPQVADVRLPEGPAWFPGDAIAWLARNGTESVKSLAKYVGHRLSDSKVRTLPCRRRGLNGWSMNDLDRLFPDLVSAIGSEVVASPPNVAASDRVAEPRARAAIEQDAPPP